jgi:hypothetical protein
LSHILQDPLLRTLLANTTLALFPGGSIEEDQGASSFTLHAPSTFQGILGTTDRCPVLIIASVGGRPRQALAQV